MPCHCDCCGARLKSPTADQRIGAIVRDMRRRSGRTQDELGGALGLNATTISRLERGRRAVLLRELPQIASALSIPVRDLIPPEFLE